MHVTAVKAVVNTSKIYFSKVAMCYKALTLFHKRMTKIIQCKARDTICNILNPFTAKIQRITCNDLCDSDTLVQISVLETRKFCPINPS